MAINKRKMPDVRIVEITGCHECPHFSLPDEHLVICDKASPKFVISEIGEPPESIPSQCPLPKRGV